MLDNLALKPLKRYMTDRQRTELASSRPTIIIISAKALNVMNKAAATKQFLQQDRSATSHASPPGEMRSAARRESQSANLGARNLGNPGVTCGSRSHQCRLLENRNIPPFSPIPQSHEMHRDGAFVRSHVALVKLCASPTCSHLHIQADKSGRLEPPPVSTSCLGSRAVGSHSSCTPAVKTPQS